MARIRSIKPEFPQSESMGRVSRDARLCFILLWTIADDEGRLRGNSRMLSSLLYPYDGDAPRAIDKWLDELQREGCLVRYKVDGNQYIEITNWRDHQKIDKPSKSKIEPFNSLARIREPSRDLAGILSNPLDSTREDSRTLSHGGENSREGSWEDGNGGDGIGEERKGSGREVSLPPLPPILAEQAFQETLTDWLAYKGKAYKPQGLKALVSRAETLANKFGVPAVVDAFRKAMANQWQGWDQDSSFANLPAVPASRVPTAQDDANWNPVDGGLGGRA
jgi:hypothetical protein